MAKRTIAGLAAILFVLVLPLPTRAGEASGPRLITVTGEGEVRAIPDEVVLTLGVETRDRNLVVAKNQNDAGIRQAIELIKKFGIEARDIQTSSVNIEPRYGEERQKLESYFVRNTIVVTLKDISKLDKILAGVIENGINLVNDIEFRSSEIRKYRDQARSLAIKAAREKAAAMAGELGQKIGNPHAIIEEQYYQPPNERAVFLEEAKMPGNTISPGQITASARVTVSFELLN